MPATIIKLTEDGQFPITRTWKRQSATQVVSGDYRIIKGHGYGYGSCYIVRCGDKTIDRYTRLATAKVAVEKHAAGFGSFVAWYNMPEA